MSTRVRLRILGDTSASIDERTLGPDATHVFAAILVLALSPENRVSRRRLAMLLWPNAPAARQAERLRWLLSKMRGLGVPIEATQGDITLERSSLEIDYRRHLQGLRSENAEERRLALEHFGAVLPDYAPDFSAPLRRWIDEQRENVTDQLLSQLVPQLADARHRGRWTVVEPIAHAIRRLSPLHEEGTLALAEALCAGGDKSRAVALLDEYVQTLGDDQGDLRLPAELLRRRMRTPRQPAFAHSAPTTAFVGRREMLQRFQEMLAETNAGRGGAFLLAGPPGIGKTRLLDEMAAPTSMLASAIVVRARCHAGDATRPLAGIIDVIPKLLELPGAAGSEPETLRRLSQLSALDEQSTEPFTLPENPSAAPQVRDWLQRALCDLLAAIGEEQTVVIQLDDFQWADRSLGWLWNSLLPFSMEHRIGWCFSVRAESADAAWRLVPPDAQPLVHCEWMSSLDAKDAQALLDNVLSMGSRPVSVEARETLLERGGGIPLVLEELARHWLGGGDLASVPRTLAALIDARLARLTPAARRTLQMSALFGAQSALPRLERVLQLPRNEFVEALSQLENAGIMTTDDAGVTQGHVLWAEAAAAQLEPSVARVLHRHIAEYLESEMATNPSVALLWEVARHWGLSGQSEQELAAITRGSEHLVRNCLYAEAAEAYGRALEISMDAVEQRRFLRRRIELFRFVGDFRAMLHDVNRHEELSLALDPMYDKHNELELLVHTAQYVLREVPIERAAEESLACACEPGASVSHRLQASFNCVRYAEQGDLEELMSRAHEIAMSLTPVTPQDVRYRTLSDILYHVTVGDLHRAAASAMEWAAAEEVRGDPYWMTWSRRYVAMTQLTTGQLEPARRSCLEAIRIAREAGILGALGPAYELLLCLSCEHDAPKTTRDIIERAKRDCAESVSELPIRAVLLPLRGAQAAIDDEEPEAALALIPPRSVMLRFGFAGRVDSAAVLLAARLLLPNDAEQEAQMHLLAEDLADAFVRPLWGQGWNAAVYAAYLDRYQGSRAADEFVRHYLRDIRRELGQLPRRLVPFAARLTESRPLAPALT
jgi:DNA-binding SARP family transcriptional activator